MISKTQNPSPSYTGENMDQNMLNAGAPFCDNVITNGANSSVVRNRLYVYYSQNNAMRNEYIQYACMYAQVLMSQGQPWQNAISVGAEAVASIFIMRIAQNDSQVQNAFQQDMQAANTTAANAQNAQNVIQSLSQNRGMNQNYGGGFNQMQQPQQFGVMPSGATPLSGAFVSTAQAPMTRLPQQPASNAVTLDVPGNNHKPALQAQATPVQKNQSRQDLLDAQTGLPPLYDNKVVQIEYIKHNGSDYFKETQQMDANAHNHSPAFLNETVDEVVAKLVVNDPVTGRDGLVNQSNMYSVEEGDAAPYTRVLKNAEQPVYVIADLPELAADHTHINHMPTIDMVIGACAAKEFSGLDASAVRDSELVEKIIYGNGPWVFEKLNNLFENSKNILEFSTSLQEMMERCVNAAYHDPAQGANVVRMNSIIKALVSILNNYVRVVSKKPNLPKKIFDGIGDIPDLMEWLQKADNPVYRTLMEPVSFGQWLNHNLIINMYEGSDNLTIESRKAVVYTTMIFHQLDVSFAKGCDKAILTEDNSPWLYYLFASHLKSSAGKRLYCPVRYFFSDDVTIDVIPTNFVTGQMLVTLVND